MDLSETDQVYSLVGVFTDPVKAMEWTGVGGADWHSINGCFWEEGEQYEIVPFVLNTVRRWARWERAHEKAEGRRGLVERCEAGWVGREMFDALFTVDGRMGGSAESMGAGVCPACKGDRKRMRRWGTRLMMRKCDVCQGLG